MISIKGSISYTSFNSINKRSIHSTCAALGAPRSKWKFKTKLPITVPPAKAARYNQIYRIPVLKEMKKLQIAAERSPWRGKWRLETVSIVERLPVIIPKPQQWWLDFEELQFQLNQEHGKKYPDDVWTKVGQGAGTGDEDVAVKRNKTGRVGSKTKKKMVSDLSELVDEEEDKTSRELTENIDRDYELEDDEEDDVEAKKKASVTTSGEEQLRKIRVEDFSIWPEGIEHLPEDFVPAPRVTDDDKSDNRQSLNRALDRRLYLIVKKKNPHNDNHKWQFLRREWEQGDDELHLHALQNTQNQVHAHPDCDFQVQFDTYHTCPSGHYFFEFPLDYQKKVKSYGAKQFFYHTYLLDGSPVVQMKNNGYTDYAWVTRQEMKDYLDVDYYNYVYDLLQDH